MATENVHVEVSQRTVECPVCFNEFNSAGHLPHILPCGNNICKACLVKILNLSKQCPLCKEPLTVLKDYPINLFLRNFLCYVRKKNGNSEIANCTAGNCISHNNVQLQMRCIVHKKWICVYCQVENHKDCHTITVLEAISLYKREAKNHYEGIIKQLEKGVDGYSRRIEHYKNKFNSQKRKQYDIERKIRKMRKEQAECGKMKTVVDVDKFFVNMARHENQPTSGIPFNQSTSGNSRNQSTSGDSRNQSTSGDSRNQSTSGNSRNQSTSGNSRNQSTSGNSRNQSTSGNSRNQSTSGNSHNQSTSSNSRSQFAPENMEVEFYAEDTDNDDDVEEIEEQQECEGDAIFLSSP